MPDSAPPSELPVRHGKQLKHALDRLAALVAVPWLLPPGLAIAAALKLEEALSGDAPGSIFYREQRYSAGRAFDLLKFRVVKNRALQAHRARGGVTIKELEHDPEAVTRVGSFLVKYYLDELPQLLHVLRGQMSIVGPRPVWPHDHRRRGYFLPFRIKAGLAGTFQLGKGTADIFDLDRIYLREYARRSQLGLLAYDLSIVARTLKKMTRGEGL